MAEMEKVLSDVDIIVSQSDVEGNIIYANPIFYRISGYGYGELIGKNHNLIRHQDMPKIIFKHLWEVLESKEECYCFIKNQSKNEEFYWVFAYIRPSLNRDGSIRNYISTRRAISQKAKAIIEPFYQKLLFLEKEYGLDVSRKSYEAFMEKNSYDNLSTNEIIYNIQY
jgi:PAS domain S-box-containing protein